jgi:hypothetical protein
MNVGDTVLDLQAGQNAGVPYNIGVLSEAHAREQLEREPDTLQYKRKLVPEFLGCSGTVWSMINRHIQFPVTLISIRSPRN